MSPPPHSRDLAEYGSLLRRRRLVFMTWLLAGVAGGALLFAVTPPRYTATAQVQVLPTGVQDQVNLVTSRQREPLNLDTESQIAKSTVVAEIAAKTLKNPEPEELREQIGIEVPPNSAVLSISFTASDPRSAAAGAQAFADAYVRYRYRAAMSTLSAQMKAIAVTLRRVSAELAGAPAPGPAPAGRTATTMGGHRRAVLAREATDLALRYDALRTTAITPGVLISPARAPARPGSPSFPVYLGSGLFLGLLCGAGAALARDRLDTRLRTADDVARLTSLPLLAELPPRPERAIFHELAAVVVTALADAPHRHLPARERAGQAGTDNAAEPEPTGSRPFHGAGVWSAGRQFDGGLDGTLEYQGVSGNGAGRPPAPGGGAMAWPYHSGRLDDGVAPYHAVAADHHAPGAAAGTWRFHEDGPAPPPHATSAGAPARAGTRLASTLVLEGVGAEGVARPIARALAALLARHAPISVVTGRACSPDAALLLVGLGEATAPEVARAEQRLRRLGARVLGVATVPPEFAGPLPGPEPERAG